MKLISIFGQKCDNDFCLIFSTSYATFNFMGLHIATFWYKNIQYLCSKVLFFGIRTGYAQKVINTPLSSGRIWSFYLFVLWNVMTILSKQKQLLKYELCCLWFTACNYGGPGGYRALHIYAPKVAMEALYLPRSHLWFIVPTFL